MQAKEAVLELVVLGEFVLHQAVDPRRVVGFVTVTVGLVVHDLAGMDALLVVDFPEDDTTLLGTAESVAVSGVAQLGVGQIAGRDGGFAELGIQRQGSSHEVR